MKTSPTVRLAAAALVCLLSLPVHAAEARLFSLSELERLRAKLADFSAAVSAAAGAQLSVGDGLGRLHAAYADFPAQASFLEERQHESDQLVGGLRAVEQDLQHASFCLGTSGLVDASCLHEASTAEDAATLSAAMEDLRQKLSAPPLDGLPEADGGARGGRRTLGAHGFQAAVSALTSREDSLRQAFLSAAHAAAQAPAGLAVQSTPPAPAAVESAAPAPAPVPVPSPRTRAVLPPAPLPPPPPGPPPAPVPPATTSSLHAGTESAHDGGDAGSKPQVQNPDLGGFDDGGAGGSSPCDGMSGFAWIQCETSNFFGSDFPNNPPPGTVSNPKSCDFDQFNCAGMCVSLDEYKALGPICTAGGGDSGPTNTQPGRGNPSACQAKINSCVAEACQGAEGVNAHEYNVCVSQCKDSYANDPDCR